MAQSSGPRNTQHPTRDSDVGGLIVRRALPTKGLRTVGAWCFFDHAGPAHHQMNVGPHPHIGLQTFTWMIAGEILHRDSLGYEQLIRPGQVNLMTAGRGIAHSEESVKDGLLHAAQLWIALPDHERWREPAFEHYPDLPIIDRDQYQITLLVGEAMGHSSPVRVYSPLVAMDVAASTASEVRLPLRPDFEHAILCLQGQVEVEGEVSEPGALRYLGSQRDDLTIKLTADSRLLLIGGEPWAEAPLLWWNFVARTQEEVAQATDDWNAGRHFGQVPGTHLAPIPAPVPSGLTLKRPSSP